MRVSARTHGLDSDLAAPGYDGRPCGERWNKMPLCPGCLARPLLRIERPIVVDVTPIPRSFFSRSSCLQAAAAAAAAAEATGAVEDKPDGSGGGAVVDASPEKPAQPGKCAWAAMSALTDCSVCLEAYRNGDRVCRLPCAHAFHADVSRPWTTHKGCIDRETGI